MIDKCSCGATCAQVEALQAEVELLKSQAEYHFESQKEDYNKLEDVLVANEDLRDEIERLRTVLALISEYGDLEHFSSAHVAEDALKEQGE
jgi:hypothetical protein